MWGRFVLPGLCAAMTASAAAAPQHLSESSTPAEGARQRLFCSGKMITADQPPPGGAIIANGIIDFVHRRVSGFGAGSHPIVLLTNAAIDFGSSPPEGERFGTIVEGSIDRRTGRTHVSVAKARDPGMVVIELVLRCEFEQPVS